MKSFLKHLISATTTFIIPLASILALVLLFYIPRDNGYWNFLRLAPFYTGIYFWQSQRPDIFNIFSAFILGIIADVCEGSPLGINVLSFLFLYIISIQLSFRFNIQKFSYSWLLFGTALLITLSFKTLMTSIMYRHFIPINLAGIELLLIFALYPLLARIYIWIERRYIHLEERHEKIEP